VIFEIKIFYKNNNNKLFFVQLGTLEAAERTKSLMVMSNKLELPPAISFYAFSSPLLSLSFFLSPSLFHNSKRFDKILHITTRHEKGFFPLFASPNGL
jgi:hypothetical protein